MGFGNFIGLVLTFLGTAITCWQAYKAKTYRDEIQIDRHRLALVELLPIAKSAREECRKIITPVNEPMRGVDPAIVISKIQTLSEKISENSHRINRDAYRKITQVKIDQLINQYKAKESESERFKIADSLYTEIGKIIQIMSSRFDASI